jgi:hypothetical protein
MHQIVTKLPGSAVNLPPWRRITTSRSPPLLALASGTVSRLRDSHPRRTTSRVAHTGRAVALAESKKSQILASEKIAIQIIKLVVRNIQNDEWFNGNGRLAISLFSSSFPTNSKNKLQFGTLVYQLHTWLANQQCLCSGLQSPQELRHLWKRLRKTSRNLPIEFELPIHLQLIQRTNSVRWDSSEMKNHTAKEEPWKLWGWLCWGLQIEAKTSN